MSLFTFSFCGEVQNGLISKIHDFLHEKSSILKNYSEGLIWFNEITYLLDSDIESQWSYRQADSVLSTIDVSGKSCFEDLTKVYAAYSHTFYGLSYTNAINTIGRGADYSLEELVTTIIRPLSCSAINYSNLAKHELASIYNMVNFYLASEMWAYDYMQEILMNILVRVMRRIKSIHQRRLIELYLWKAKPILQDNVLFYC